MTKGEDKTKEQLMKELAEMRRRIAKLEESERKYRLITENSSEYISMLTFKGIYTYVSPSSRQLGYEPEELLGKSGLDMVHPDDRKRLIPLLTTYARMKIRDLLRLKKQIIFEQISFRFPDKSGRWHYMEATANLIDAPGGKGIDILLTSRDVTERRQAEEALREERDKAREYLDVTNTILSALPHAVIGLHERHITFANNAVEDVFGLRPEELIGKTTRVLYRSDEEYEEIGRHFYPVLDRQKTHFEEFPCRRKDGRDIVCLVSASRMGEDLRERKIVATYTDITEHRRVEETLRESEEKYRTLFEDSRDAVFITTRDGKLTSTNQAYLNLFGYTGEEVTGLDVRKTYANPDDRFRYQQEMEQKGAAKDFELKLRKKDGAELDCLLTATTRQSQDGVTLGYQGIIRDITEHKQVEEALRESEEKYRGLVENVDVGICWVTPGAKGDFIEVNPAMSRILGYSREEFLRMNVSEMYQDPAERKGFADKVCAQGLVKNEELKLCRKDGTPIVVSNTSTAVRDEKENIIYIDAILEDITERKKAEAEKLQLERKAQMASRLATVGEMASGIAHEINNPLTAVIGYADLVLGRDIPQEVKDDVRIIHEGTQRVADIVKRLLTFARQYRPERTYLDINDIIKTTLKLRAYELETSNIKVTTDLAPDLPRTMADAGQLQQVLLNLIINAETEMKLAHGGGKLLVRTGTVNNTIRISFKDDGPGISKENLEKIFNPFFTTREVGRGTGLGLSLSHGIISEHNGRIYAKSKPGKGATFIVELPVITEEKQLEMAEPAEEVKKVARARILVVDDEPAICQFLKRLLTGEGHEVETVTSAGDALEKMKGTRYNLILLDIKLPGRSGIELYKSMQKIAESLARRVAFITGDVMGADTRDFLSSPGAEPLILPSPLMRNS